MKICEHENCKKRATYTDSFDKPKFCKTHKKDNMKTRYAICLCGKSQPFFGLVNDKKASCCGKCKTDDMINIVSIRCKCGKARPVFGYANDKKATCCSKCKTKEMTNIKDKKCFCGTIANFGLENDNKPTCCIKCKTSEMIDIKNKKCVCKKAKPSFGLITDKTPTCCAKCKTPEMIDIISKKCPCGIHPSFGLSTDTIPTCCRKCKTTEMINIKDKRCKCTKSIPVFGLPNDKVATCCSKCRTSEMIDIINKKCKSNYLEDGKNFECNTQGNKKYKGYCSRCYGFHFPLDPLTFQIRSKTKEIATRDFINTIYEGFQHDKPIWTNNCECTHRRRIDHRKLIGNTLLCIGTDENQHKYYDKRDEVIRYDDLMMIHGGKFIYIRFNPDKYKVNGVSKNPTISTRLIELQKEIDKQIKRIENEENTELLEIIPMYYDT